LALKYWPEVHKRLIFSYLRDKGRSVKMKIAWLSSWPPRHCGIATYSSELVEALRDAGNDIHIICHTDGGKPGEKKVHPIIDTKQVGWDEKLYEEIGMIKPDVIHIQHEFGLYRTLNDNAAGLFRPLFRWKIEGKIPVVITYHSVYSRLNKMISSYMDVMQRLVDAGIVHAEYQWAYLPVNLGRVFQNIYVIPHGAKYGRKVDKKKAKRALGLEGKKVVGMIGWFTPTKGFHCVLGLWDDIAERLGPETVLLLAGEARLGDPNQINYKKELLNIVDSCSAKDRIKIVLGSFSPEEYGNILAAFDAMVMPYTFASQSGNLAHSFSLGVPVIVSGLEGLKADVEASGAGIAVSPDDDGELKRAIVNIVEDDSLREKYSQKARRYVREKISWPITAHKLMKVYSRVIAAKRAGKKELRTEAMLES
jgi:glycosyltransferase involved in cell wall biosynthesis